MIPGILHGSYWDRLWENMEYWKMTGDSESVALSKAYWWDYIEVWNYDKSWDEEKKQWCKCFNLFFPNCKCPED